jgi:hypothetical protein
MSFPHRQSIEIVIDNKFNSQSNNNLKTVPVISPNVDKIQLTKQEAELIDKCIEGSIFKEEVLFSCRSRFFIQRIRMIYG